MRKGKVGRKEAILIKGIVEGKSATQSALDAGYGRGVNAKSAAVQASRTLNKPNVLAALDAALDKAGATIEASARVIAEGHKATTTKAFKTVDDRIIYSEPMIDYAARREAAKLNLNARRLIGSGPEEGGGSQTVNLFAVLSVVRQASGERGLPL